ncbi:alpha/beta fold hydrolase [Dactylosporangium sp. CA-092794]|uniref:alpha/beta fold hydrolase n=1 Tax=Dactylosporangium sp. CA-092794 TaxID=3239929 RepID=UPI003D8B811E
MADGSLHVRGARLAYSDEGTGPIVISAHGLLQSRANDRAAGLVDWAALPAAGYRLISYDARGHGESEGTPEPGVYRWTSLAEDLLAVADHFSPGEPVRAIGVSMGTGTILSALVRAPQRFAAVTLGAPPTAWQTRAAQAAMYEEFARLVEESSADDFARMLAAAPVPPIFERLESFPGLPAVAADLLPSVLRGAGGSDLPAEDLVAALSVPALILGWETDPGHPVVTADRLAELLPAAELHLSATVEDIRTWAARAAAFFAAG